ncbi:MAG: gliding motility-associated C-terminal domain-containing protein [Bacteroidales bacterium]|jgi:gliding motility-associated-like protein|nr:gliding motility-associated C-terminal domain-containing protein [Bacteroidales bacterium]
MKEIGELFKEKLTDQQEPPPLQVWEKIAADDNVLKYNSKQGLQQSLFYILPAMIIVAIAVISIVLLSNSNPLKQNDMAKITPAVENPATPETVIPDSISKADDQTITSPTESVQSVVNQYQTETQTGHANHLRSSNAKPVVPVIIMPFKAEVSQPEAEVSKENSYKEIVIPAAPSNEKTTVKKKPITPTPKTEEVKSQNLETDDVEEKSWEIVSSDREEVPDLSIPDAFSPNADGLNDEFGVVANRPITDFNMMVYDRTGQQLFQTRDINAGWNGEYKGQLLPTNSYLYIISYKNSGGENKIQKGMLILVR